VVSGIYAAKWHNTGSGWMLEAEIFTPLRTENGEKAARAD
jgi:hypothetical protein